MMLKLIDEWRLCFRFWSVRLSLIGSALLSGLFAFPEAMFQVWNLVPVELRAYLPDTLARWIPIVIIVLGVAARLIKQEGLRNAKRNES